MVLYISDGGYVRTRLVQNVTTDRDGVAAFSLSTASDDFRHLYVSKKLY